MNLSDVIALTAPVEVHAERCIRQFSPRASCRRCVQLCPSGSIRLDGAAIELDACDGCGRCIQACPHDVFEMDFPAALALPAEEPLVMACRKHDFPDLPVLQTACLQQFTWLQLAVLVQRFGEVILYAEAETCAGCEWDWFGEGQRMLMQRYGLAAYAEKVRLVRDAGDMASLMKELFSDGNPRRQYMRKQWQSLRQTAEKYTRQSLDGYLDAFRETVQRKQALHFEKTQSQAMLLHELYDALPEVAAEETLPLQALAASRCRFCHTCERLCPWGALAIIEEEGHAVLAHHDVLCARCGLCIDLCPERSLHWDRGLTIGDIATPHWRALVEATAQTCARCGEPFYPTEEGQKVCAICKNKG